MATAASATATTTRNQALSSANSPAPAADVRAQPGTYILLVHLPRSREIEQLLALNRTIEAIRRYRELTGADLTTAKAAVEQMATPVRPENAGSTAKPIGPSTLVVAPPLLRLSMMGCLSAHPAVENLARRVHRNEE